MRVIAELPHPDCKITLFSMNQKLIVKFEQGNLEQVFKVKEADVTEGVNGLFQMLDDEFIEEVIKQFHAMRTLFKKTYERHEQ